MIFFFNVTLMIIADEILSNTKFYKQASSAPTGRVITGPQREKKASRAGELNRFEKKRNKIEINLEMRMLLIVIFQ